MIKLLKEKIDLQEENIITVSELTEQIKYILETEIDLSNIWIKGEISNLVKSSIGHLYFTLKDKNAVIKVAIWASILKNIKTDLSNGTCVLVRGDISVYPPRGEYQLIVTDVRKYGIGSLYEEFEKLKAKLELEGLFSKERKVKIPFLPKGVGVVTSPKGAVIQDIFRVIRRRFPNMPIYLFPARVQGEGSVEDVIKGIKVLDEDNRVDVIIIARGGGSIEDLWTFNEEAVARAIAAAKKPVISGVGHETDFTIADFVSDLRAATPSQAGELAVPLKSDLQRRIVDLTKRLERRILYLVQLYKQRLYKAISCRFLQKPSLLISEKRLLVMNYARELEQLAIQFFSTKKHQYMVLKTRLESLNPKSLLKRGYVMVLDQNNEVISTVKELQLSDVILINFIDGQAKTKVEEVFITE